MCPSPGTSRCSPLPSRGFRPRQFPTFVGTTGSYDSSVLVPLVSGLPRPSGTSTSVEETRRSPTFVGNPSESVPRAGDSGGSTSTSPSGARDTAFRGLNHVGIRNVADFGAESARPAPSLSTLHLAGCPAQVQDSLPACPLRRWPGWIFTSWIPVRGFTCS
jgi:hypothetical protein